MSTGSLKARLQTVLEPVVAQQGCDVEDVAVTPAGSRRLVRVLVDRDGGITLDDVAELSRVVSETLDAADVMGSAPYVLEVSSPGVDHPLTLERHWRRAAGRLVKVSVAGVGSVTARVLRVEDGAVVLSGPDGSERLVPLAELGRGAVQVEFNRPGSPDVTDDERDAQEVKA